VYFRKSFRKLKECVLLLCYIISYHDNNLRDKQITEIDKKDKLYNIFYNFKIESNEIKIGRNSIIIEFNTSDQITKECSIEIDWIGTDWGE